MPAFNKIDENKMAELIEQKRTGRRISKREKIMQMYMEQLKALKVGEGLEVVLEPGDNRQTGLCARTFAQTLAAHGLMAR